MITNLKPPAGYLAPDEEIALARRREAGDQGARDALVEANLPLSMNATKWLRGRFPHYADDIHGEALLALIQAANAFDASRGLRFTTYATATIQGRTLTWIKNHARLIRVPATSQHPSKKQDTATLADAVARGLALKFQSISEPFQEPTITEDNGDHERYSEMIDQLSLGLRLINPRSAEVVRRYHGLSGERETFKAIAVSMGVTKSRINQIYQGAIKALAIKLQRNH